MNINEGKSIKISRILQVDPSRAFEVVYDVANFPSFMPSVTSAEVISDDGDHKVVEWEMSIDGAPLIWTEDIRYNHEHLTAEFKALDGMFLHFDGTWRVSAGEHGTKLEVSVLYDLGLPEIEAIIGPVLDERIRQNLDAMLENIEMRAGLQ